MRQIAHLLLDESLQLGDACAMARSSLDARTEIALTGNRYYLDTPDRHLLHQNQVFECDVENGEVVLALRCAEKLLAGPVRQRTMPASTVEVVDFDLRRRLNGDANSTALIVADNRPVRYELMRVRNEHGKTIAWLYLEQFDPGLSGEHRPPVAVRIVAFRGYFKESRKAVHILRAKLPDYVLPTEGIVAGPDRAFALLPEPLAVQKSRLSRNISIADGVTAILTDNFRVMVTREQGIEADLDIEFLHDFRIALRRIRSIFGAFGAVFAAEIGPLLKPNLRWLNRLTGTRRDLDVYLDHFPEIVHSASPANRTPLQQICEFVATERRLEQDRLVKALNSDRYAKFKRDWSRFLSAPTIAPAAANRGIMKSSGASIWKTYKRIRKQICSPDITHEIDELHTLRKDCKKLRYQIEAFAPIYPKTPLTNAVGELKHLQDILGAVCDNSVQQRFLLRRQSHILQRVRDAERFEKLLDGLLEDYAARERRMLRTIRKNLDRFASKKVTETYRKLFEFRTR